MPFILLIFLNCSVFFLHLLSLSLASFQGKFCSSHATLINTNFTPATEAIPSPDSTEHSDIHRIFINEKMPAGHNSFQHGQLPPSVCNSNYWQNVINAHNINLKYFSWNGVQLIWVLHHFQFTCKNIPLFAWKLRHKLKKKLTYQFQLTSKMFKRGIVSLKSIIERST